MRFPSAAQLGLTPLIGLTDVRVPHTFNVNGRTRIDLLGTRDRVALRGLFSACTLRAAAACGVIAVRALLDVEVVFVFTGHLCSVPDL